MGAKYDFGSFGATLALFQLERPSAFLDPETNLFSQDGEQRNRGLELTVFGEPVAGVRLLGGYSFIDAELAETADDADEGNTAPGVPEHRFSALAEWNLPFLPELTLTGAAFRTSKAYLTQDNEQDVPGFTTFDLGARYRLDVAGKPVTLRFAVENVTDNDHWVATTFGGSAALGGPRRILLSTSFEF